MFYTNSPTHNYTNTQNPSIIGQASNKYFVYNCVFSNQQDGCIYIEFKDSIDFLHSFCLFHDNFGSGGGSIYFSGNSQIVQHRFCAYNSTADLFGLFSSTSVGDSGQNANYFNYHIECSLTHCNFPDSDPGAVIDAHYGIVSLSASNSSQNNCPIASGYLFSASYPSSTINYTTLANNTAEYSIASHSISGAFLLTKSNIINNEIIGTGYPASSILLNENKDILTVDSCYFFGNKTGPGKLFCLNKNYQGYIGKFLVKSCHIDEFSKSGYVETSQIKTDSIFVYLAQYFSTYKCDAIPPDKIGFVCIKEKLQCTYKFFRYFLSYTALSFGFFII